MDDMKLLFNIFYFCVLHSAEVLLCIFYVSNVGV